jgi:glutathione S-transferase
MKPVTLYDYPASANCLKARILLALLRQPYERVDTDIFAGATLTDAFGALNPARETPVLVTADGDALAQSNAIIWFLAEGTPYLPDGSLARARVVQWLFFEQERVLPGIGGPRFRLQTGRAAVDDDGIVARLAIGCDALGQLEGHLAERRWLVGDEPTIADVSVYAYAHLAEEAGIPLAPYPAFRAWVTRLEGLPGFVNDLAPYPANAAPGAGRSIYDPAA